MKEPVYGFPCVSNPNDFSPDVQSCTEKELSAHRKACETWGTDDYKPNDGCEWLTNEKGEAIAHVTKSSWGIGVNMVEMDEE
jgi:hypothetical protein